MSHGEKEFIAALEGCGALRFGDFTLASGAKSNYYIDIKRASTDPRVLELMAGGMAALMEREGLRPDRIAGVVLGSVPLATALSLRTGIPFLMVRKESKDHGTRSLIEGTFSRGEDVLVVEDVVTSAGSLVDAVGRLRDAGLDVSTAISAIDREAGGSERLAADGVKLHSLLRASSIPGVGK
ncbi:MAG: orotate phosphoribosyltransferase [Thermoplasmatales archaeon]|nr:orotate phosphoribosyltransferase [Thermoplasmatales archaeon]